MSSVGDIVFLTIWFAAAVALIVPTSARWIVQLSEREIARTERNTQGKPRWLRAVVRGQQGEALRTVPQCQRWGVFMIVVAAGFIVVRTI